MARARPVFHEELGQFFKELREARGWSLRQAADIARRRGLDELSKNVLGSIENGKTQNPKPQVFTALAELYGTTYESLVGRYIERRFGLVGDLIRHDAKRESPLHETTRERGSDVPASDRSVTARILELERALKARDRTIAEIQDVARRLFTLVLPAEDQPAGAGKARGRRSHRKAG